MPTVTIGVVPRERFSAAGEALQSIYDHTALPFNLVLIDCAIPPAYRRQIDRVLAGRGNVTIVRFDRHVLPNQSRNLVLKNGTTDFICLVENDVIVRPGWLDRLIAACEEHPADVAAPLILERLGEFEKVHFDDRLGRLEEVATGTGTALRILPQEESKEGTRGGTRREVDFLETHCVLFRSSVFERVAGFDESITAQEEVDMSLSLRRAGFTLIVEPASVVTFLPPPPVYPDEKDYYCIKWNPETYAADYARVAQKWNLIDPPSAMGVVHTRRSYALEPDPAAQLERQLTYRRKVQATADEIARLGPSDRAFILVHDGQLNLGDVAPGRHALPFLERDGQDWGPPQDSAAAIDELERMRSDGVGLIVIAWPSFWWLDYYADFAVYLRAHYPCVLDNEHLVAFRLRDERAAA